MNAISHIESIGDTLSTRAMLLSPRISQWTARKLDRDVTDEVNQNHGAVSDASRLNKLIVPKEALEPIQKVVSETRNGFIERTLPWMNDGSRVMACEAYLSHVSWINRQKSKFDRAVSDFLAAYPGYVAAAAARLGSLYKASDYPDVSELRDRFQMETRVMPVPTSGDFRANLSAGQVEQLRADIESDIQAATQTAVRDVYRRIHEVAQRMVDRLGAYKPATKPGEKAEGIFRDSLVSNVRDLIDVLPSLNILGDPQLAAMADKLRPLAENDAADLRDDEILRRNVASEAEKILADIGDYLS